jgi:hypothetical protein
MSTPNSRLSNLRSTLSTLQLEILDTIWNHFREEGRPLTIRALFHKYSRDKAEPAINQLGGRVVIQNHVENSQAFLPTLLGVMLSNDGLRLLAVLGRGLQAVAGIYEKNPEVRSVSNDELSQTGLLQESELEDLRLLMELPSHRLVISRGGSGPDNRWQLYVHDEVDVLRNVKDWVQFTEEAVLEDYDPKFPVSEGERLARSMPSPRELLGLDGYRQFSGETTPSRKIPYVDENRLNELRRICSERWDLTRLIRLCEELNEASNDELWMACAMLVRSITDHVPPIFDQPNFTAVSNNHGNSSFKKSMSHLAISLRNIANSHLHAQIRSKESLPTFAQINFCADLDVLLSEIVRILK